MTETIAVNAIQNGTIRPMTLTLRDGRAEALLPRQPAADESQTLYLSDGFIDSHAHVYDGATDLGVSADRIGYQTGVHLVVDAGSAGAINFPCFRDYVMPAHETPVLAFLNISRVGLVTKQPYFDPRVIDVTAAVQALKADGGQKLLGIKVLSSGLVVEKAGLEPLRAGVQAARECGVPVMVHLVEGPPANEDTMPMLQKGMTLDPTVVSPAQTLAAATYNGAQALGYSHLGLLKPGYLADLILLDLDTPQMNPCNDMEGNLIYAAQGSDVRLTMVDGKVLYRDGRFTTLDAELVKARARKEAEKMAERYEAAQAKQ